jgi:peroxiredoxin Q/BCP
MADVGVGDKAPDFSLPGDGGKTVSLKALKGKPVVIYFYPKDDTPGCTKEACDFRDGIAGFRKLKADIIGISKDSVARHDKFKAKYDLPFALASDEDGKVLDAYGVWKKKSLYGRTFLGIERTTFLIDEKGVIRNVWRKVKVKDHANQVMEALKAL